MKTALFIGGTGTISKAVTELIAADPEWKLTLVNRGNRPEDIPAGVELIRADVRSEGTGRDRSETATGRGHSEGPGRASLDAALEGRSFDCVVDFIAFRREDVERDWRLFNGRTGQFILISSASAYDKWGGAEPVGANFGGRPVVIDESTPLRNPFWQYSRDKIACEEFFRGKSDFPATIVRPSHTYAERKAPVAVHGAKGSWQVLQRMIDGKPVVLPGDGTSLWCLTHSTDFAKGFVALMGNPAALGQAYHITSGESLSWNEIYRATGAALGVEPILYHANPLLLAEKGRRYDLAGTLLGDKANSVVFDNSKIKEVAPDFEATVKFSDGIRRTVDYILSHEDCRTPDPEFDAWCDDLTQGWESEPVRQG